MQVSNDSILIVTKPGQYSISWPDSRQLSFLTAAGLAEDSLIIQVTPGLLTNKLESHEQLVSKQLGCLSLSINVPADSFGFLPTAVQPTDWLPFFGQKENQKLVRSEAVYRPDLHLCAAV
jgi:hypothetical protein